MTRGRGLVAVGLAGVLVLVLAACSGKVRKRAGCRGTGERPCKVLTVDDNKKERWRFLTRAEYAQCQVGETYPACGGAGYGDGETNQDREERERKKRSEDERRRRAQRGDPPGHGERDEDCNRRIQVVVGYAPDGFVRVEWTLEDRNGSDRGKKVIHSGAFSRSRTMCPGGLAKITAVDVGVAPDTMHCIIRENGVPVAGGPPSKTGRCSATYVVR